MKTKKRARGGAPGGDVVWGGEDHEYRKQRKLERKQNEGRSVSQHRQAVLTHETAEKKSQLQLRLHLTKIKRDIESLKSKLSCWDPDEAAMLDKKEEEDQERALSETTVKKKGRKGPESWKLRGPARPAWQVYDFDTRYVDPHMQALEKAKAKSKRSVNLLLLYKGRMASIMQEEGASHRNGSILNPRAYSLLRQYLGLLMQLGHLSLESKHYKSAREAWLECVELEGTDADNPLTTARESLIRMYLQLQRWDTAWDFLTVQVKIDSSVWIVYSRALVAVKLDKADLESFLIQAVRTNVYCAYYLAFYDTFRNVMEYTGDVDEGDDVPQTDLEQAIEYCNEAAATWQAWKGDQSVKCLLLEALAGRHTTLTLADVEWKDRLVSMQVTLGDTDESEGEELQAGPDIKMFAGMFHTAMEMLQEAGQLSTSP